MFYAAERKETKTRMHNSEPGQFSEKCLDSHQVNWFIQNLDIFFPKFKSIFIDKKDDDLFRQIDSCKHQKVVAVVNQWHMESDEVRLGEQLIHTMGTYRLGRELPGALNGDGWIIPHHLHPQ